MMPSLIAIEVVFATPQQLWTRHLRLVPGATIAFALEACDWQQTHPEFPIERLVTGVYGKRLPLSYTLHDGDRLEIYRPLSFDPKQSRRRRAIHRQKIRHIKKKVPINDSTI